MQKDYCTLKTENNYYAYNFINQTFKIITFATYKIVNYIQEREIKEESLSYRTLNSISAFQEFSIEELNTAIREIESITTHIATHKKKLRFVEYQEFSKEDVLNSLANTKQVVLELTRECNLSCFYCCFGNLYSYKRDYCKKSSCGNSLSFLKKILELKMSKPRYYVSNELYITFFGGEPLCAFTAIEEIVQEVAKIVGDRFAIRYLMTTNGVLLGKYIKFLVANNFKISVSMDGNADHHAYRVFPNGKESFEIIENNLIQIKQEYPDFFQNNIDFISVLHNRSSYIEILDYFKQFGKVPTFTPLSTNNIKLSKKKEFPNFTYKGIKQEEISAIERKYPEYYKGYFNTQELIRPYCSTPHRNILGLFSKTQDIYPGKSCLLFSKRVFVTNSGLLFPCEKTDREYCFGKINEKGIAIYTKRINQCYKEISTNYSQNCNNCYRNRMCDECYFLNKTKIITKRCQKSITDIIIDIEDAVTKNEITI